MLGLLQKVIASKGAFLALFLIVMVCGTAGYAMEGYPVYESVLKSFFFLVLNGDLEHINPLIEVARWAGIIFALDVLYSVLGSVLRLAMEEMQLRLRSADSEAIAVHGDSLFADKFAEYLGPKGIRSDRPASFNAPYQTLMFTSDEAAIDFFSLHEQELSKAQEIYINFDEITAGVATHDKVFAFSLSDTCAQFYWDRHPVDSPETVVLVGSGNYAEALLSQGLLVNIFDIPGGVGYHVFGDFASYRARHTGLADICATNADTLAFHDEPWYEAMELLAAADRIVLCDESAEHMKTASLIREAGIHTPIHIRCDGEAMLEFLGLDHIEAFGTSDEMCTSAIIVNHHQHDAGKRVHAAYLASHDERFKQHAGNLNAFIVTPEFRNDWGALSEFTKESNYAVAAFDGHRRRLMEQKGISLAADAPLPPDQAFEALSLAERDELQEIEHIRWSRFHYLHNWSYGPGEKDPVAHTHPDLVAYDQLTREEKDKDGDSYKTTAFRMH